MKESKKTACSWGLHDKREKKLCAYRCLGKIFSQAVDGRCYAIGFVDSFNRFSKIYFMKARHEVFKQFCADVGKRHTLVCDGGGEHISNEFKRYCRNQWIRFERSAPCTPEEIGKIERIWGTSVAMTHCFLENACLEKILDIWFENGVLRQKYDLPFS